MSDGRKVVRVRIGYVSMQLRWIVRSQELGSGGTRVIDVGFLDPPFLVTKVCNWCKFLLVILLDYDHNYVNPMFHYSHKCL